LIERFARDLASVWSEIEQADAKLGIAVSGGPDSLALLLLARAALPSRVEAATVDHGLRAESAEEADFVARLCGDLGIPHAILPVAVAPGNTQDRARQARYTALDKWTAARGMSAIAMAHHADDQAETLLMRLNRGSGLSGLAGVRASTKIPGGTVALVRPLLGWRRAELRDIVAAAGIDPVQDSSNADRRFDRVRMREALRDCDWIDVTALAVSAAHIAEAEEAFDILAAREWAECVERHEGALRYRPKGPSLIRKRVVQRIIAEFGGEAELSQVADTIAKLEKGGAGTLAGVMARARKDVWTFAAEPPRRTG
jgi:tRNA(Ile)-lysidine synthase